jgi:hypothetical protein
MRAQLIKNENNLQVLTIFLCILSFWKKYSENANPG